MKLSQNQFRKTKYQNYIRKSFINMKERRNINLENESQLIQEDDREPQMRQSLNQHNPVEQNKPKAKNMIKTFGRLFSYTLQHKWLLFMANFGLLGSTATMIYLPLLSGMIIDHIKQNINLLDDVLIFLCLSIGMGVFSATRGYSFNLLGQKIVLQIRKDLFQKLVSKDISYYDKNKSGALISRLTSDTSIIESAASDNISMLVRNFLQFLGSLVFLYIISWKLTTFILVVTPIVSIAILFVLKKLKIYKKQYQSNLAFANSLANQVFGNIRVVRSFSNEQTECRNYNQLLKKTYETGRKQALIYALLLFVMIMFANFLILSVLYFGGSLAQDGQMTIGSLTSFVLYTITLTTGFTSVSGILNQITSAMGVCESIFQIMDEPVLLESGRLKVNFELSNNLVEFKNVRFAYPSKESVNVLDGLNLQIKKGESIAIVGSSGSGKSSIVNLILRFYDVNDGELLVGGVNIKELDLDNLRHEIGYVSQEPTLFSGSLRQNIQYGLKNYERSQLKVMQALQISNSKEFVMNTQTFPETYNTLVGQRGVKLSGGQKQRIAIARCIIKSPKLLIFDEATSALDAESEHMVQSAIDRLVESKSQTMIIVAHRLSTIINCDRIIVLKDGKIVESGKHKQLLMNGGIYANLVKKQISSFD